MALQRLKTADDGFRKQLETKEMSHAERVRELTSQYELRIAEGQHRVRIDVAFVNCHVAYYYHAHRLSLCQQFFAGRLSRKGNFSTKFRQRVDM